MDEVRIVLPMRKAGVLHILAAVSGGADSVALLALLREAARTQPLTLTAAHFEHGIRAEASDADAAFVRALCAEWGIPLIEGHADVPAIAMERSVGLEEAARDARHEFLRGAMMEAGADYVALAHHRDDQAETVLMHLLRGAGLRGLTGMKEIDGALYRPLLEYPKETLVGYLEDRGIPWREDATNQVADNPRNALRLNVIPQMERIYPGAKQAIIRFSRIAAEEDRYMEEQAGRFEQKHLLALPFGWMIELKSLKEKWIEERALLMRTLRRRAGMSHESVVKTIGLWEDQAGDRAAETEGGWRAERGACGLYLIRKEWMGLEERPLADRGETILSEGMGRLKIRPGSGIPVRGNPYCQELNAAALEGAVIRARRPGDFIHPLGAPGRQKLSDYFINRKVDRPLRDIVLLIAKGNEILWVMGEGISERAKLQEGTRAIRLELTDSPLQKFGGTNDA